MNVQLGSSLSDSEYDANVRFLSWLESRVINAGCGCHEVVSENDPSGRFWLGRLAPEEKVAATGMGDRGERLEPCALGIRLLPLKEGPWSLEVRAMASCWLRKDRIWQKVPALDERIQIGVSSS